MKRILPNRQSPGFKILITEEEFLKKILKSISLDNPRSKYAGKAQISLQKVTSPHICLKMSFNINIDSQWYRLQQLETGFDWVFRENMDSKRLENATLDEHLPGY
ncbi:hypothetical protein BpHYR1_054658 [Brachionus plicatilis]|uniref:Uncharacterized protein n=1 Tax=Brachionus plicatilis TaxID=10195 RepID=A0A3M7PZ28_BRAPC|nr:hypothetical protein BpHYR1_054658 [Brachionus plicatilis]